MLGDIQLHIAATNQVVHLITLFEGAKVCVPVRPMPGYLHAIHFPDPVSLQRHQSLPGEPAEVEHGPTADLGLSCPGPDRHRCGSNRFGQLVQGERCGQRVGFLLLRNTTPEVGRR